MFPTKVNKQKAEIIREQAANGATIVDLMKEHEVSRSTIVRVLQGEGKGGWYRRRRSRRKVTATSIIYGAFIEEILAQMRTDTYNTLFTARDHVANENMRIKINEWSYKRGRPLVLEASEGLRELLLQEMEQLFQEPEKE